MNSLRTICAIRFNMVEQVSRNGVAKPEKPALSRTRRQKPTPTTCRFQPARPRSGGLGVLTTPGQGAYDILDRPFACGGDHVEFAFVVGDRLCRRRAGGIWGFRSGA